ncbi:Hypothetical protein SMAX5B_020667 [Scophthalmus maximus]|uniref:Uncharacterized protein n=1 Tax=Scophthalmus maximus TaxID=52904 RepID=A0A2U9AZN9_SCOMX|nr:Hypothetical protein SMAX5B_020667 [Scophthalmus maximus]KAF0044936.1 hypothetical protein F2P81_001465 [Scophthalmus maximus]
MADCRSQPFLNPYLGSDDHQEPEREALSVRRRGRASLSTLDFKEQLESAGCLHDVIVRPRAMPLSAFSSCLIRSPDVIHGNTM